MRDPDVATGPDETRFKRFDDFSWRAFIALNWPALRGAANRGQPDRDKNLGDLELPRVWETWKSRFEVFAPGRREPAPWNSYKGDNPCGTVGNDIKTLSAFSHYNDFNQAAMSLRYLGSPLVAQNRTYTRYEVRINETHFDTIVKNKWFAKLPTRENPGTFQDGSINVKAAWRILNERDTDEARKRFYVTDAMVFDPVASATAKKTVCNEQRVALVGFHIVIKTQSRPQWIWSSFEHIDNVPPRGNEPDAKAAKMPYSYNSGGPPYDLSPSSAPSAISPANLPTNTNPMQVVRKRIINDQTMDTNRAYWALPEIKDTVWKNYMLVMTQWPSYTRDKPSVDNHGFPFPRFFGSGQTPTALANTTLETYQQHQGASCMECHHAVSNRQGMDFVAFMAFDVTDPPQRAIARSTKSHREELVGANKKARAAPPIAKTALDDHPSVRALARFLHQRSAR